MYSMFFSMGVAELLWILLQPAYTYTHVLYCTFHFLKFHSAQCNALSESRISLLPTVKRVSKARTAQMLSLSLE